MKKINKLQLKKSVVANLTNNGMNQVAGGQVPTTTVRDIIDTVVQYSNPCSDKVACYPTAYCQIPTRHTCPHGTDNC